ncbi:hypothetical protein A6X21_16980 [Planctopirus hydrillae]|uniref:Uncharacterized protein n=1 Tax=Planctopirus hydrillae TaxID=1841610 RepID=A0A1C3EQM1_9PLAN|nr:hypothetical protein A6X21_16980 [Planctopirus hydrillae]
MASRDCKEETILLKARFIRSHQPGWLLRVGQHRGKFRARAVRIQVLELARNAGIDRFPCFRDDSP